jgi:hypothetical protein
MRQWLFLVVVLGCAKILLAQDHSMTDSVAKKKITIAAGATYGNDFTNLNVRYLTNTQTNAYEGRIYVIFGMCRLVANYEKVPPVDLKPGWLNVRANYYDLNLNIIKSDLPIYLYPIVGIFVEQSSGFYTGKTYIPYMKPWINKEYNRIYEGINLGGGLEIRLGRFAVFGEMRGRLMDADHQTICDEVFLTCGMRVNLFSFTPPVLHLKKIFRNPNDKYHWF